MFDPKEKDFQNHIIAELEKQGWLVGESRTYNKKFCGV